MFYKFKTKPYAHQLKALEMSWTKEVFAYFMEMGTGKSKVLLDNVAMLFDNGKINVIHLFFLSRINLFLADNTLSLVCPILIN